MSHTTDADAVLQKQVTGIQRDTMTPTCATGQVSVQNGIAWDSKHGWLSVDWSYLLDYDCELQIGGWDSGLWAASISDGDYAQLDLTAVGDWILLAEDEGIRAWKSTIPEQILKAVDCLPADKLGILGLCAECSQSSDLLISNPLLLWLLYRSESSAVGREHWIDLVSRPQRDLVAHIGLIGGRSTARLLQKAAGALSTVDAIRMYAVVLRNADSRKYLSHAAAIRFSEVKAMYDYPWVAGCQARAILQHLSEPRIRRNFNDTIALLDDLEPLKRCKSLDEVSRLHERLVEALNRQPDLKLLRRDEKGNALPLPEAPIHGTDAIVPLTTQQDIISEGHRMKHCIATYIRTVLEGNYYVYSGLFEEPVTIGVMKKPSVGWVIDDVRAKRNADPSKATMSALEAWLRSNSE
ncbi:conserved hypothetical protein [Luminiphilus syltensis NOR5-1B]|uniref:PcfJ-like protein n=1 Tax=Luminiphilus syltensis NOR5-1B TaxID=565045 RepID=B8KTC9_9GAMM|nr:PcfJ domain-containing protein [Luminiphilus syltensis]EED36846.1 conserved hypothetical protein [Luminiphilus syltensis NOR5-1B]